VRITGRYCLTVPWYRTVAATVRQSTEDKSTFILCWLTYSSYSLPWYLGGYHSGIPNYKTQKPGQGGPSSTRLDGPPWPRKFKPRRLQHLGTHTVASNFTGTEMLLSIRFKVSRFGGQSSRQLDGPPNLETLNLFHSSVLIPVQLLATVRVPWCRSRRGLNFLGRGGLSSRVLDGPPWPGFQVL
jgi:hypothetical protein